jgi:hypothetical protein
MTGVTADQFDDDAQASFQTTIATNLVDTYSGITSDDVVITGFSDSGRRTALTVEFTVYTGTSNTSTAGDMATSLNTFLAASDDSGFASAFNTQATADGVSVETSGVSVTAAPEVTTFAPTAAPTDAPTEADSNSTSAPTAAPTTTVVDSAPVSAGLSLAAIAAVGVAMQQIF